jgi:hypothetical protein
MLQYTRNSVMELDCRDRHVRFLIHDRDTKFSRAFARGQWPASVLRAAAAGQRWL